MQVTALGHAGLKVQTRGATLLCDPWFSPEGAFLGSWHQYPCNEHLLSREGLTTPTAVVITHEHLDHLDPWFLAQLPRDVPAIVPAYPSPVLRQKLSAAGERPIIELEEWQRHEVAPGTTVFFVSEPPMNHDSAVIIEGDGKSLLNLNDARLFPMQLRQIRDRIGRVDMLFFQGAGASWYPMCYQYPPERIQKLVRQKRMAKLGYCMKLMQVVEPVTAFPFAGPPVFLDPELMRHNEQLQGGIFPDQREVADFLARKSEVSQCVLLPGDSWDAESRVRVSDPVWSGFSFADAQQYIQAYADRRRRSIELLRARYPHPAGSLWPAFRSYFNELVSLSRYFNQKIGMRVGFDVTGPGGGSWSVDFASSSDPVRETIEGCSYTYRLESRWLQPLLKGEVSWEDFFLSLRFEATREPDLYNDHLLGLLKFANTRALDAVEQFETKLESDERITVRSDGIDYSISRFCPHAGNDLRDTGEVLPGGVIRCLAHHYEFDLKTGQCTTGSCPPIDVKRLTSKEA